MSEFLEIPPRAFSPTLLYIQAKSYVIPQIPPNILRFSCSVNDLSEKEKEFIQLWTDVSKHELRMYGSAEELLENINIYKNFPANHKFFEASAEAFQNRPIIFKSLKDEKYIAKSDLFVILQNTLYSLQENCPPPIPAIANFYLRFREKSLDEFVEFVKFDEKFIGKMKNKVEELKENLKYPYDAFVREFQTLNMTGIVGKFEFLIPSALDLEQRVRLQALLEGLVDELRIMNKLDGYLPLIYVLGCLFVDCSKTVIDENLEMFLPRRKDSKQPITVRVFEDGDQRFVMESEFKKAVHKYCEETNTIENTISMESVQNTDKNIEFIRYPITRAKHRATPIQGPSGDFFILIIDFFFELMRELIHEKIFQKLKPINLSEFLQNFNEYVKVFYETESPYFIKIHTILPSNINENSEKILAKEVRNSEPDGFTLQNLKNELGYLGLTTTFPDIQNYAEGVYLAVDKNKKEEFLRTCDLFDAIEHCQLNCILDRLPNLKKFVHNQKGCHRVYGFKCEECDAENSKTHEDQKLAILEKELADLKISHLEILEENQQKSLEIQELQQKNLRLTVKNETNEVKVKQLTEKLAQSKLSIDEGNYSTPCTSNSSQLKIQCLICKKSIFESGEDQIIRCPLCKRRFHSKCAINWLKEHKECPACNGDLSKSGHLRSYRITKLLTLFHFVINC
ncbi:unnamed protein product [Caenorhabditis nigoni]